MLRQPRTPQSTSKPRALGIVSGKTPRQASTTYRHQAPCRPFVHFLNLKPVLTLLQELAFNTKNAPYTPLLVSRPKTPFPPARTPHLFHAPSLETDARSEGYLPGRLPLPVAGTSDPVAAWSRVRSAVLLAHSPNFRSLLHWGSPGEPDPPLKRSVTHGEGRGRH